MIWSAVWYYLLALFSIADVITTKIAIATGHFEEVNPLMVPNVGNILEIKIIGLIVIALIVCISEYYRKDSGWFSLAIGSCAMFNVVLTNILKLAML
jgi:hypothetical protein